MRPPFAYLPPVLERGRAWGFGINLYALRSKRNWGIGDFTDLRNFVRFARATGADVVGVNPLHALHYAEPEAASPYSPTSRYFLNPIYVDVETVPEFLGPSAAAAALRAKVAAAPFASALAALRATDAVAYARVAEYKWAMLEALFTIFSNSTGERRDAFERFCERRGERLERFALYEALGAHFTRAGAHARGWLTWPQEFRDATAETVRSWGGRNCERVTYFKYVQWLADEQLAAVAHDARALAIGLYLDVAVGVDADSADVWSDPRAYVLDEAVGAPPDELGPLGQNWGLPPLDPTAMLSDDGATFASLLRANMQYAGALRLDHAMALMRLFRIPHGRTPLEGAYVDYPFEELLALAAGESVRARCLIVGEDLGTVPPGFRERMQRERILSYRVLLFERAADAAFKAPSEYPELALATCTTHDIPTLSGWCVGRDIAARQRAGFVTGAAADAARTQRRSDVLRLLEALRAHGGPANDPSANVRRALDAGSLERQAFAPLIRAAYNYLAASPARVVLVQLDDALGELEQVNLPGTSLEYPNWRRKNALDVDAIAGDAGVAALVRDVAARVKGMPVS